MAITNYAELKTAVADWLHRSDLTVRIPDFISLAEDQINRRLRIVPSELEAPMIMTVDSRFLALPSDFGVPIALWLEEYEPREKLTPALPSELNIDQKTQGQPLYWAIDGTNIAFDAPADRPYKLRLRYVSTFKLSDINASNWLLADSPGAYLYGALAEAAPFLRDDDRIGLWQGKFEQIIQEVKHRQNASKSIAALMCEPGIAGSSRFNINRGY